MIAAALPAQAQVEYTPQVGIPGAIERTVTVDSSTLGRYVKGVYEYGVGVIAIVAAIVLMVAGVMWLTAGGSAGKVEEAKEWIKAAITGLILALVSYTILLTINPDLIEFKPISVTRIESPTEQGKLLDEYFKDGAQTSVNPVLPNLETGTPGGQKFQGIFQESDGSVARLEVRENGSYTLYRTPAENFYTANSSISRWEAVSAGDYAELRSLMSSVLPLRNSNNPQFNKVQNDLGNFLETVETD